LRLNITLNPSGPVMLPVHYNHILQSAIYANLGPDFGTFIHDEGYERGSRIFKPLTFSRLRGSYRLDRAVGTISFDGKVHLVVCSPVEEICRSLGTSLLVKGFITLAGQKIPVECIKYDKAYNTSVFVVENGTAKLTPVRLGLQSESEIEVVEGLKQGDKVILNPSMDLKDGMAVVVEGAEQ